MRQYYTFRPETKSVNKIKKLRSVAREEYSSQLKKYFVEAIKTQGVKHFSTPVGLSINIKGSKRDLDNDLLGFFKELQDSLVITGVIRDDCKKHVRRITVDMEEHEDYQVDLIIKSLWKDQMPWSTRLKK